jgi:hypothetical protein
MLYTVKHQPGFSAVDHLGDEVARNCVGPHPLLVDARHAIREAYAKFYARHGVHNPPRMVIVRSDGKRF